MTVSLLNRIPARLAIQGLNKSSTGIARALQRLSTGQRIASAADDAAGLAEQMTLRTETRVLGQALRNISDGISLLSVAESATQAVAAISQRMRELAAQSANGIYTSAQRTALDTEFQALIQEYNRTLSSASFNGISIFPSTQQALGIQVGSRPSDSIQLSLGGFLAEIGAEQGDIPFGDLQSYAALSSEDDIRVGDVNGDGKLDLVSAYRSGSKVVISLGNGDGTFQAATSWTGAASITNVSVGDVNNDGYDDVVSGGIASTFLHLRLSNGDGTFKASTSVSTGGTWQGFNDLVDINRDGNLDMVVTARDSNALIISYGNGNGTFKANLSYAAQNARNATFGDINGDGYLDAIVGRESSANISLLIGNADGSFTATSAVTTLTGSIDSQLVDLNADGALDLVATGFGSNAITIRLGNGNGTFKALTSFAVGNDSYELAVADVNADGILDVVVGDATLNYVTVGFGVGDGTFSGTQTFAFGSAAASPLLADLDGDGAQDLVVLSSGATSIGVRMGLLVPYDIQTQANARTALDRLDEIDAEIAASNSYIAAQLSRMDVAWSLTTSQRSVLFEAEARISDLDVAEEVSTLVRLQILQQTQNALLAQANQQSINVLRLLDGLE